MLVLVMVGGSFATTIGTSIAVKVASDMPSNVSVTADCAVYDPSAYTCCCDGDRVGATLGLSPVR